MQELEPAERLDLAARIEAHRKALRPKLSQAKAADRAGISEAWWSKVVRGKEIPAEDTVIDMARAVGYAVDGYLDRLEAEIMAAHWLEDWQREAILERYYEFRDGAQPPPPETRTA